MTPEELEKLPKPLERTMTALELSIMNEVIQRIKEVGRLTPVIDWMLNRLVAIGETYGRASWIGLAGAVLVFLALLNWRWVPVFLLVGLAAIPFLPETIYNRILTIFNAGEDSSVQYRFGIYETTRNLMEDYWARGVGLGTDVMKKVFQTYPTNFDGS